MHITNYQSLFMHEMYFINGRDIEQNFLGYASRSCRALDAAFRGLFRSGDETPFSWRADNGVGGKTDWR